MRTQHAPDWQGGAPLDPTTRAQIADRRKRFAERLTQLTGMAPEEAAQVFVTLPQERRERRRTRWLVAVTPVVACLLLGMPIIVGGR